MSKRFLYFVLTSLILGCRTIPSSRVSSLSEEERQAVVEDCKSARAGLEIYLQEEARLTLAEGQQTNINETTAIEVEQACVNAFIDPPVVAENDKAMVFDIPDSIHNTLAKANPAFPKVSKAKNSIFNGVYAQGEIDASLGAGAKVAIQMSSINHEIKFYCAPGLGINTALEIGFSEGMGFIQCPDFSTYDGEAMSLGLASSALGLGGGLGLRRDFMMAAFRSVSKSKSRAEITTALGRELPRLFNAIAAKMTDLKDEDSIFILGLSMGLAQFAQFNFNKTNTGSGANFNEQVFDLINRTHSRMSTDPSALNVDPRRAITSLKSIAASNNLAMTTGFFQSIEDSLSHCWTIGLNVSESLSTAKASPSVNASLIFEKYEPLGEPINVRDLVAAPIETIKNVFKALGQIGRRKGSDIAHTFNENERKYIRAMHELARTLGTITNPSLLAKHCFGSTVKTLDSYFGKD